MDGLIRCGLFRGLPDKELKSIGKEMSEVEHQPGAEIMRQGDDGAGFMVILDGEAEVHDGENVIRVLGPGQHFGEMALLDAGGRSRSVRAKTPVRLAALPRWSFEEFMLNHPLVTYRLAQTLTQRLREAEEARP
jgi:CRP/FNR family cyclic AMP-dependent transcriptional regulator